MRLHRVLSMSREELLFRSRQRLSITLERLQYGARPERASVAMDTGTRGSIQEPVERRGQRVGDYLALRRWQEFGEQSVGRFFPGSVAAAELLDHHAEERERCLESANHIRQGRFPVLGYGFLSFLSGDGSVDWHQDPVNRRRAPFVHWSRIDPLNSEQCGDSKIIWEPGRHQWLLDLGQAWQYTGDEEYARAAADLLRDWMRNNPPGMGIHWSSSLEIALRMISWCWALLLLRDAKSLTPGLFVTMEEWIRRQALHVERYLSTYFSPNTHLTGEALGLFHVGVLFPQLRDSLRWRELGRRILVEQISRQVAEDGVYFEQSTRYQVYTAEIYLHFVLLAERNNLAVPAHVLGSLQRMLDFLRDVQRPDGTLPQIGDTDGGALLPLVRRSQEDVRGLFSIAAARFRRDDYSWIAGGASIEALRFHGPGRRYNYLHLRQFPPVNSRLRIYPRGGYAIVRNHWRSDAHHLIFDAGPLGCPVSGGHGHADLLSLQCSVFGEPCLVDPGTGSYLGSKPWRNYFRGTSAHNTAMLDGRPQAVPAGPFSWSGKRPAARLLVDESQDGSIVLEGKLSWDIAGREVVHRRRVAFFRQRYWVVVDDFEGSGQHAIAVRYQFAPRNVSLEPDGWIRARCHNGAGLLLRTFSAEPLAVDLASGRDDPPAGWVSPDYGRIEAAPQASFSATTDLPLRVITLLYPIRDGQQSAPSVNLVSHGAHGDMALLIDGDECDRLLVSDSDLRREQGERPCVA